MGLVFLGVTQEFLDAVLLELAWAGLAVKPAVDRDKGNTEFLGQGLLGKLVFKAVLSEGLH